jgi:putative flippase GtrA
MNALLEATLYRSSWLSKVTIVRHFGEPYSLMGGLTNHVFVYDPGRLLDGLRFFPMYRECAFTNAANSGADAWAACLIVRRIARYRRTLIHAFEDMNMAGHGLQRCCTHPAMQRLFSHVPPGEFFPYLLVGGWNTVFGYATFVFFTYLFSLRWPENGYIIGGLLSSLVSISVAFLAYKRFVFKTAGHYWQEWLRCMTVYGSSIAIGSIIMPCLVFMIRRTTAIDRKAPYVAAAVMTGFNALYNFVGNKKFSFRR